MLQDGNWLLWALMSAIFASMTAILAKVGVRHVDADLATLIRTIVVALVLAPLVFFTGKWIPPWQLPGSSLLFLFLSALATGASWVCYFRALQLGDASLVAPVDKLSLVGVVLFAFALLGERPQWHQWLGIAMVAGGVLLVAIRFSPAP
jgi:transporter family protein